MAGKGSGYAGESRCAANQRYPGGKVGEQERDGNPAPRGGGVRKGSAQPDQKLPREFAGGSKASDGPSHPLSMASHGGSRAQPTQRLPSGSFDSNGTSQGDCYGTKREANAYQGPRSEGESTPAKPGN